MVYKMVGQMVFLEVLEDFVSEAMMVKDVMGRVVAEIPKPKSGKKRRHPIGPK